MRISIHIKYWAYTRPDLTEWLPYRNIDCAGYTVDQGIMTVWGANADEAREFSIPLYHVSSWSWKEQK